MLAPGWKTPQGIPTRGSANPPLSRNRGAVALRCQLINKKILMSKTRSLHHIVFATAHRFPFIPESNKRELYAYIFGILRNKNCFVHRINGMRDHIHILIDLNPSIALADLVRDIKRYSSLWMNDNEFYPQNSNWAKGYYAVSLGADGLEACVNYIKNQEIHHHGTDFMTEAENLARQNGLRWYPDDWE